MSFSLKYLHLAVHFFSWGRACFGLDKDCDLPSFPASAAASPALMNPLMPELGGPGQSPAGTSRPGPCPLGDARDGETFQSPQCRHLPGCPLLGLGHAGGGNGAGRIWGTGERCGGSPSRLSFPGSTLVVPPSAKLKKNLTPKSCILCLCFFQPQLLGMVYTNPLIVARKCWGGVSY